MKKFLLIITIIAAAACSKNESDSKPDDKDMWHPAIYSLINDSEIHLRWFNSYMNYLKVSVKDMIYLPDAFVNSDYFDIYWSESDMNHFQKFKTVEYSDSNSYTLRNLENDKQYFIYVVARKKGYPDAFSDTITAVPNPLFTSENLISYDYSHTVNSVSFAANLNKIAYVDNYYTSNTGTYYNNAIIISNLDGSNSELLDIKAYEPDWSPDNSKILFRTEKNETNHNYGFPSQIAIFDYQTKSITRLTNDTVFNGSPVFSFNGQLILYQSNKNCTSYSATNIWLYDLNANETRQITEINDLNLLEASQPNWTDNNHFLFQGKGKDYKTKIYISSISEQQFNPLLNSKWNEYRPSISPDKMKLAFISDRSGRNQIWIYDFADFSFRMITGFSGNEYINSDWCKISWINNSEIIFTNINEQLIKRAIE